MTDPLAPIELAKTIGGFELAKALMLDLIKGRPIMTQDIDLVKMAFARARRTIDALEQLGSVPGPYSGDELPRG